MSWFERMLLALASAKTVIEDENGEILAWDRVLTAQEMADVHKYLRRKYRRGEL